MDTPANQPSLLLRTSATAGHTTASGSGCVPGGPLGRDGVDGSRELLLVVVERAVVIQGAGAIRALGVWAGCWG